MRSQGWWWLRCRTSRSISHRLCDGPLLLRPVEVGARIPTSPMSASALVAQRLSRRSSVKAQLAVLLDVVAALQADVVSTLVGGWSDAGYEYCASTQLRPGLVKAVNGDIPHSGGLSSHSCASRTEYIGSASAACLALRQNFSSCFELRSLQ